MTWIYWSGKQTAGHAGMDHGHKILVDLINQLADGMQQNMGKEYCSTTLERFIEQPRLHFLAEDQLMDRSRFPKATEHKALHESLIQDVLSFKSSYDAADAVEYTALIVILESWLDREIMAADRELAHFVVAAS